MSEKTIDISELQDFNSVEPTLSFLCLLSVYGELNRYNNPTMPAADDKEILNDD